MSTVPGSRCITSVSRRPGPATRSGWAQHASADARGRPSARGAHALTASRSAQRPAPGRSGGSPSWAPSSRRCRTPPGRGRQPVRSSSTRRDAHLHGMVGAPVAIGGLAHVHGGRQHGGMLARAVVMQGGRRWPRPDQSRAPWRRPAARARRSPARRASGRHAPASPSATAVWAGVPECEAQAMAISARPRGRSGPRRPSRRTAIACSGLMAERGKTGRSDIADSGDQLAVGRATATTPGMRAFDQRAAGQLDQDGIAHGSLRLGGKGARLTRGFDIPFMRARSAARGVRSKGNAEPTTT